MKEDISPPPLKRQRLNRGDPSRAEAMTTASPDFTPLSTPTPGALRIFSWNVNGIAPFVQPYLQRSIKSFFKPSARNPSTTAGRKRRRRGEGDVTSDSEDFTEKEGGEEDLSKEGRPSLRIVLQRFVWPHILFLQEVKIKPGDAKTMGAVRRAVNEKLEQDEGPEYEVHFNLPEDPYNAKGFGGKVYGVATIIRKDLNSQYVQRMREVKWDREGRVQVIETKEITLPLDLEIGPGNNCTDVKYPRGNGFKLAIINIYAVNGTSNSYRSTHTGVEIGTRHDRKLAVHTELLSEAVLLEAKGFYVIVAGDLNVARCELDGYPNLRTRPYQHVLNRTDFNDKFFTNNLIGNILSNAAYSGTYTAIPADGTKLNGFNGIDTFRHIHGDTQKYSYHPRGLTWGSSCDRVDLIIASRALSGNIANAGIYDSPRDRGPSDHCPVWVEIGIERRKDD
ncbi:hypothetical protein SCUP515_10372 [Seiridium cupressi]